MAQKSVTLNTGAEIPAFGLGTWQSKPGAVGAAVEAALRAGYRHIDCAHIYGNEPEIGEALLKCFKDDVVKREDIFITSKLWNTEHPKDSVIPACELTLKNLQLDYLDLYLIHWPQAMAKGAQILTMTEEEKIGYSVDGMDETYKGMEECLNKGLVKAIGISNCPITKIDNLLKTAKIVPAVNQVECHPYFQQQKLKEYCDSKGIVLEAYSPLGNPSRPGIQESDPVVMENDVIKEIAEKHKASVAQICIAFGLRRGLVVIPKSVTPSRIEENLKSTEIKLDAEDVKRLREEDKNIRLLHGRIFFKESDTTESFWDVVEDEKFEVKQPDSKKQRTTE